MLWCRAALAVCNCCLVTDQAAGGQSSCTPTVASCSMSCASTAGGGAVHSSMPQLLALCCSTHFLSFTSAFLCLDTNLGLMYFCPVFVMTVGHVSSAIFWHFDTRSMSLLASVSIAVD